MTERQTSIGARTAPGGGHNLIARENVQEQLSSVRCYDRLYRRLSGQDDRQRGLEMSVLTGERIK
jgi:hypothetical protein